MNLALLLATGLFAFLGIVFAIILLQLVFTDLHLDSNREEIMLRHVDENGTWINDDGWVWINMADTKGHKIRLRQVCVQVEQADGSFAQQNMIVLGSEPF